MFHHDSYQFGKRGLGRVPAQLGTGFGRVTQQLFHFARTEVFRVHFHQYLAGGLVDTLLIHTASLPFQLDAQVVEGQCTELTDRMHFSRSDDEILGGVVLQNQPHAFHVVLRIAPVAAGIQVTQVQLVLVALLDAGGGQGNLAGHEVLAASFALVVEEDAVHGEHAVAFAVVLGNPEAVLLGYPVRRTRIERGGLLLRHFLYFSEEFRSGGLVDAAGLVQSADTYRFQQSQCTDGIRFGRIFRHVERYLHVALCGQVIDFRRVDVADDAYQ